MSDLKGLVLRGSVFRIINLFANMSVAFYLMPFLIHTLGDRWYGMWTLIATFMGYYGYLDFGLSVSVQRYIAVAIGKDDKKEISKILTTALGLFFVLGMIAFGATLIIIAIAPYFFSDSNEIYIFRTVLLALGINVGFTFALAPINGLMTGHLRYDISTTINITKLIIRTILIVYFIKSGYSIIALAFITLFADVGGNLVKMLVSRRIFKGIHVEKDLYSKSCLKDLFSYGGKIFVNQLADLMRFRLDHFVIASFINLSSVAMFNIASQLVHYFRRFMGAIMGVLTPLYARYQAEEDKEAVYKAYYFTSKIAVIISILVGGAGIAFGKDFISLWMGEEYLYAYTVLVVLLVPIVFFVAQSPANSVIYGLGAVGILAKVSIIESIANLILSIALVGPYGLIGVALGTGIPLVAFSVFLLYLANRLVEGKVRSYFYHVSPAIVISVILQTLTWYYVTQYGIKSYLDIILLALMLYPVQLAIIVFLSLSSAELLVIKKAGLKALGIKKFNIDTEK